MGLKRFLLRYDPPGLGLETEVDGKLEVRHKSLPPTALVNTSAEVYALVDEVIAGAADVLLRKRHRDALVQLLARLYQVELEQEASDAAEGKERKPAPDAAAEGGISEGTVVVLVRLKGKSQAHNGEVVTVTRAKWEREKFEVQLPTAETLKVRGQEHLVVVAPKGTELAVGGHVCIRGLRNHVELNGCLGRIVECHEESRRYEVRATDSGQLFRVKQENLLPVGVQHPVSAKENREPSASPSASGAAMASPSGTGMADGELEPGSMVKLHGLKSAMQYNGQNAEVMSIDRTRGRYEIRMADGSVKTVRAENVRLISAPSRATPRKQSPRSGKRGGGTSRKS